MEYRIETEKDIDTLCELRKKQLIDEGTTPDINIDEELHGFFQNSSYIRKQCIYFPL